VDQLVDLLHQSTFGFRSKSIEAELSQAMSFITYQDVGRIRLRSGVAIEVLELGPRRAAR